MGTDIPVGVTSSTAQAIRKVCPLHLVHAHICPVDLAVGGVHGNSQRVAETRDEVDHVRPIEIRPADARSGHPAPVQLSRCGVGRDIGGAGFSGHQVCHSGAVCLRPPNLVEVHPESADRRGAVVDNLLDRCHEGDVVAACCEEQEREQRRLRGSRRHLQVAHCRGCLRIVEKAVKKPALERPAEDEVGRRLAPDSQARSRAEQGNGRGRLDGQKGIAQKASNDSQRRKTCPKAVFAQDVEACPRVQSTARSGRRERSGPGLIEIENPVSSAIQADAAANSMSAATKNIPTQVFGEVPPTLPPSLLNSSISQAVPGDTIPRTVPGTRSRQVPERACRRLSETPSAVTGSLK